MPFAIRDLESKSMRKTGLTWLIALLLLAPAADALQRHANNEGWIEDYKALRSALEARYANLAWFASPSGGVDLVQLNRRTLAAIVGAGSDAEAEAAIRRFVEGFHDGHLHVMEPRLESDHDNEPPLPTIDGLKSSAACAALGFEPAPKVAFSSPFETLPSFEMIDDGISQPFRSGVVDAPDGSKIGVLRIARFRSQSFPALCITHWETVRGLGSPSAIRNALADTWFLELHDAVERLKSVGAEKLLVDVADNPGGDNSGDVATRIFSSRPLRSQRLYLAHSAGARSYLDEAIGRLKGGLTDADATAASLLNERIDLFDGAEKAATCSMNWVWNKRRDWNIGACNNFVEAGSAGGPLPYLDSAAEPDPRIAFRLNWAHAERSSWSAWNGPLFILINEKTYSAAELFVATLRDNDAALLVGSRTGGDGCGFMGDDDPITLPHSRLRIQIPNCARLRADGTDEVAGIAPDIKTMKQSGQSNRAFAADIIKSISSPILPPPAASPALTH